MSDAVIASALGETIKDVTEAVDFLVEEGFLIRRYSYPLKISDSTTTGTQGYINIDTWGATA